MRSYAALLAAIPAVLSLLSAATSGQIITEFSDGNTGPAEPRSISAVPDGAPLPPEIISAASRKAHGNAGAFELPLSGLPGNPTTEPRTGPAQTIVVTFDKAVISGTLTIIEGTLTAATLSFSGSDAIVDLEGVIDRQYVTISLSRVVSSDGGGALGGAGGAVRVGFLLGDVNQNRVVSLADLGLVNEQLGHAVTAANFLKDVDASGTLSLADKGITNAKLTRALPPPF